MDVAGHLIRNFNERVCDENGLLVKHFGSGLVSCCKFDEVVKRSLQQMERLQRNVLLLEADTALQCLPLDCALALRESALFHLVVKRVFCAAGVRRKQLVRWELDHILLWYQPLRNIRLVP